MRTAIIIEDLPINYRSGETVITKGLLRNLFAYRGIDEESIIIKKCEGRKGVPYAYAYVIFNSREKAERAIKDLNYTKFESVPIRLSLADPETNKIKESGIGNLFVKGLGPDIEVSQLHEAFAKFGEIISCKVPTDYDRNDCTYHSRCYGYVQFRNPRDAERACYRMNYSVINGSVITVEPFAPPQKKCPEETFTNVYLKELPWSIQTNEDLEALISPYGRIQSACLPLDDDQKPKGFAFCNMESHDDALNVIEALNGMVIEGKKLVCCRHMPKAERIKKLRKNRGGY